MLAEYKLIPAVMSQNVMLQQDMNALFLNEIFRDLNFVSCLPIPSRTNVSCLDAGSSFKDKQILMFTQHCQTNCVLKVSWKFHQAGKYNCPFIMHSMLESCFVITYRYVLL